MRLKGKRNFEASIADMVRQYRQTGKVGKASPKAIDKARKAALAEALKEDD